MSRARDTANTQDNIGGPTAPYVAGKNAVINGGMDIWQRGTSFTDVTAGGYNADRYMVNRSGDVAGINVSRSTDIPTGFVYSMKWQRASGNTNTSGTSLYYGVESNNSYQFAGQTSILSFYAKRGANYSGGTLSVIIGSGTAVDAKPYAYTTSVASTAVTLNTSWTRYTLTGTFASNIAQVFYSLGWTPTGTAGADDSVYVTGVQLEIGSIATPFSRAGGTIQGELAACQRYYYRIANGQAYSVFGAGAGSSATVIRIAIPTHTTMRVYPTSVDYSGVTAWDYAGSAITFTSLALANLANNPDDPQIDVTGTGITTHRPYYLVANNNVNAYVGLSAEL